MTVLRALFFGDVPHRLAGAQRSLLASLTRIPAYGVEPTVIFPGPGICVDAYRDAGIRTRIVAAPPSLLLFGKKLLGLSPIQAARVGLREVLPYAWAIARLIDLDGAQVVHYNTPRGILSTGLAAKVARRPAVLHLRGVPAGFSGAYWAAAQFLADRIVLVAQALADSVLRPFQGKCSVVYNGVPEQAARDRRACRRALAERLRVPSLADEDTPLFVSLSSPVPFKGLHHLYQAAAILRDRGIRAEYVLAGSGPDPRYEAWLERRRRDLCLEDLVHSCGFIDDPKLILSAADALVLPSIAHEHLQVDDETIEVFGTEGLPRSVLEAMSLGVPAIATAVAGVSEQIEDGVTGLLVEPGDPNALAQALERVARDRSWRAEAGERAREVVRTRFTIDAAAAGLASVLRGCANASWTGDPLSERRVM